MAGMSHTHIVDGSEPRTVRRIITIIIAVAVLLGVLWLLGFLWFAPVWRALTITLYRTLWAILLFAVGLSVVWLTLTRFESFALTALALIVMLVALLGLGVASGYMADRALLDQSHVTTERDAATLSYAPRAPLDVADAVGPRNLGATTGNRELAYTYLPADGEWTGLVARRGIGVGYEKTQVMRLPLTGGVTTKDVAFCTFNANAGRRLEGMLPGNSLDLTIANQTGPTVTWDHGDAFAACEDGTPRVFQPLVKWTGFPFPHPVAAGVAIYDGHTGTLTVKDTIDAGTPVYPMSLAARQRDALKASGSFWDYVFDRAGYRDTASDEDDPNGENRSEISLERDDGTGQYVTPLTVPGSSSSVVGVSAIDSGTVNAGQVAPLTIHLWKNGATRAANSAIAQQITGDKLQGYKATGLKVFEIVPAEHGAWRATVGKTQSVLYVASVSPDGTITLDDMDDGTGDDKDSTTVGRTSKNPKDMTVKELRAEIDTLLDELETRSDK